MVVQCAHSHLEQAPAQLSPQITKLWQGQALPRLLKERWLVLILLMHAFFGTMLGLRNRGGARGFNVRAGGSRGAGEVQGSSAILVEGRDDTCAVVRALGEAVRERMFEVDGSNRILSLRRRKTARNSQLSTTLKQIARRDGIVVLTDPDIDGMRIRLVLDWLLDGKANHCFVSAFDACTEIDGDVGIEHASDRGIRNALRHPRTPQFHREAFTYDDLMHYGLAGLMHSPPPPEWRDWGGVSARRLAVSMKLGFGSTQPKSLLRCLNRYNFSRAELAAAVETMPGPSVTRQLVGLSSANNEEE